MRCPWYLAVLLSLLTAACNDRTALPTVPSTVPTPTVTTPSPRPEQLPPSRSIELGQIVSDRVTSDDPLCDTGWRYHCRYYRITAPHGGMLNVTIAWNPQAGEYPLDMGLIGPSGGSWSSAAWTASERRVTVPIDAGDTYLIEVWSFLTPDEPFELRAVIAAK